MKENDLDYKRLERPAVEQAGLGRGIQVCKVGCRRQKELKCKPAFEEAVQTD